MSFGNTVWERGAAYGHHSMIGEMSKRAYIFAVSFFTLLGLSVSALMAYSCMSWQPNLMTVLVVGLVIPIAGILMSFGSKNWLVSLLGYMMVVIPLGAICGPTVAKYETTVVINTLLMTAGVTAAMSIIGVMYPKSLEHWSKYLFAGLLVLIAGRIVEIFVAPITDVTAPVP